MFPTSFADVLANLMNAAIGLILLNIGACMPVQ